MIAGLIALAAANALVIGHPSRDATLAVAVMLCGGPGMFLLARAWYQRRVFATAAPRAQVLAIGVLIATVAAVRTAPALVAALAVVAVLAALVIVEHLNVAT
jgi:low temperature requirement protein LtrA